MLRFIRKVFRKPVPVRASWEQAPVKRGDLSAFLDWFDDSTSVQDTLQRAAADWNFRFAGHPEYAAIDKRCALEIGFGGGRLMLQASRDFERVLGVDIHQAFAQSAEFLRSQQCTNFELLHRDEIGRVPDASVDFVYSFIVFQHFDSFDEVRYYLAHIRRVLKPTGYAHVYFGLNEKQGISVVPDEQFELRGRSLLVEPRVMVEELAKSFEILECRDQLPKDPITKQGRSGQFFVKFRSRSTRP
jgi:SAM-dependent methyltransferase